MLKWRNFLVLALAGILFGACGGMDGEFGTLQSELRPVFSLPPQASQVAHNIFYLGTAADVDGEMVEGYAFLHPAKGGKPGGGDKPTKPPKNDAKCYGFLGAKWNVIEPYTFDPTNADGIDPLVALDVFDVSITTWEDGAAADIFGDMTGEPVDGADRDQPDDKNEVLFGEIEGTGTIGVTIVWGVFGGPPFNRRLVEWDMIFDDPDFTWGDATVDPSVMDFQNIATHELGHAAGLDDLYETTCSEETMYGYGTEGETKKRDLNAGDIKGINELY